MTALPIPPLELRIQVGPTNETFFDNPTGAPVFPYIPAVQYTSVFDWGCGCGRLARQLMQQNPPPVRYLGVDLNRAAVTWCRENLMPHAPSFRFEHLDIYNPLFNPEGQHQVLPFPIEDRSVSLVIAWSVFTHVIERDAAFWLSEVARVLEPDGIAMTTWLLFNKSDFPMMTDFQNALYINADDPTNAVFFDRQWLREAAHRAGLVLWRVFPAAVGRPSRILLKLQSSGVDETEIEVPFTARVRWISADVPPNVRGGTTVDVSVSFTNTSDAVWPSAGTDSPVRLSYAWNRERTMTRFSLPHAVEPGETVAIRFPLQAPAEAGSYEVTFELVQEFVYWFADCGADVLTIPVNVAL